MAISNELWSLAKLLHDARMQSCYMGIAIKREQDKFPPDMRPHQYTEPQPHIDIAMDQAKAVMKAYDLHKKETHNGN